MSIKIMGFKLAGQVKNCIDKFLSLIPMIENKHLFIDKI